MIYGWVYREVILLFSFLLLKVYWFGVCFGYLIIISWLLVINSVELLLAGLLCLFAQLIIYINEIFHLHIKTKIHNSHQKNPLNYKLSNGNSFKQLLLISFLDQFLFCLSQFHVPIFDLFLIPFISFKNGITNLVDSDKLATYGFLPLVWLAALDEYLIPQEHQWGLVGLVNLVGGLSQVLRYVQSGTELL